MTDELPQFFRHDAIGIIGVKGIPSTYAWHGRHRTAHFTSLRQRMGW